MHYLTIPNLQFIDFLFQERKKTLNELVAALQINDVKEDVCFVKTVERIKKQILLTPVTFGEPTISDQYETTRDVPPNSQQMWGGQQKVFNVTVDFPFTGSNELFENAPNNVSYGGSSMRVYQPGYNSVPIEVQITQLDKKIALSEAKRMMETTINMIAKSNPQVTQWNTSIEPVIDGMLNKKREELINFYK